MGRPQRRGRSADEVNAMATPTTSWTKLTRRLQRDGNPLLRRSDLIDGWLLHAVIAAFLIIGPLVAVAAGLRMHADNAAAQRAQMSWHPVNGVVLRAVPGPEMSDNGTNTWVTWTPARWTAAGQTRTGEVPATAGTWEGSTIRIWLDRAGNVQMRPLTAAQASDRVVNAALTALAGLAVLLAIMALLARRMLDRRRLAGWEADWQAVGPQWSHHG